MPVPTFCLRWLPHFYGLIRIRFLQPWKKGGGDFLPRWFEPGAGERA
jgi:hypothetical protein